MNIPTKLKHKPLILCKDYNNLDGKFAYNSDVKGLSLGIAKWSDEEKVNISAKVWRHTGERWSQKSEELPLHRVIDLAILICRTKLHFSNSYGEEKINDKDSLLIESIPIQGEIMDISLCNNNEDIKLFNQALSDENNFIEERLKVLSNILKELEY